MFSPKDCYSRWKTFENASNEWAKQDMLTLSIISIEADTSFLGNYFL